MVAGSFPDDPGKRKAIIVLHEHDIERCGYEPGAAQALLDDEVYILQYPLRPHPEVPPWLQDVVDAGLTRPGSILVQSPYDRDLYEEAEIAPQRFALAKHMYFSTLCMHLGAKEVVVEQIDLRTRSGTSSLDVRGERLGASVGVTVGAQELEKLRAQMHLRDEFEGGPAAVGAAETLLRRTGLWADPTMRTLVEMRRDSVNQLRTRKLVLSLSSEAKGNLNVVGRLKIPGFVALSGEYDRVLKEQHEYTLTVVVKF